jgi:WhiB family redox-sensing transcriptional regulator
MMHHQGAPVAARSLAREDWRPRAACRFTDPELFFPISDSGKGLEQAAEAKAVCAVCVVRRECLAFAIRTRERHGVWGGTTEQERYPAGNAGWPERAAASAGAPCALDAEIRTGVA